MKLTFSASVEVFDKTRYLKAVQTEVRRVFMKAGQRFLLAAIPLIPIWTGMARGAFLNAEDLFGKVTNDKTSGVRIRTTRGAKQSRGGGGKDTPARRGWFYQPPGGGRVARTPQAGRMFSTASDKILEITGASLASGRSAFYFRYEVDITYFTRLDEKWGAMRAGGNALEAYVRANLQLPDPLKFMTRKIYKAG